MCTERKIQLWNRQVFPEWMWVKSEFTEANWRKHTTSDFRGRNQLLRVKMIYFVCLFQLQKNQLHFNCNDVSLFFYFMELYLSFTEKFPVFRPRGQNHLNVAEVIILIRFMKVLTNWRSPVDEYVKNPSWLISWPAALMQLSSVSISVSLARPHPELIIINIFLRAFFSCRETTRGSKGQGEHILSQFNLRLVCRWIYR